MNSSSFCVSLLPKSSSLWVSPLPKSSSLWVSPLPKSALFGYPRFLNPAHFVCSRFLALQSQEPRRGDTQTELDLGSGDTQNELDCGSGDTQNLLDLESGDTQKKLDFNWKKACKFFFWSKHSFKPFFGVSFYVIKVCKNNWKSPHLPFKRTNPTIWYFLWKTPLECIVSE